MTTYIAERGVGQFGHRFGGTRWKVAGPSGASPEPSLILTLDFGDPHLGSESFDGELPLCSRTDGDSLERQSYRFDPKSREVTFSGRGWKSTLDAEDQIETPFPESSLVLRPAVGAECWDGGEPYDAQDTFLGGRSFLRVLGSPLWIGQEERAECTCGNEMLFVAAVGYESGSQPAGLLPGSEAFFLGELALYFFACFGCNAVEVVSQAG